MKDNGSSGKQKERSNVKGAAAPRYNFTGSLVPPSKD